MQTINNSFITITFVSYVAVFLVKILIQELVDMGSLYNLDGKIGHLTY